MRPRVLFLGLVLVWWGLPLPQALAHGVLERSIPSPNSSLQEPPARIALWFSEPVDPTFSSVVVEGTDGVRRDGAPVVSAGGRQVTLPAGTLGRGVYTVRWRVLSSVDGHVSSGFFVFAVGQDLPAGTAVPPAATPEPWRIVMRWLGTLTALVLSGVVLFLAVVYMSVSRRQPAPEVEHRLRSGYPALVRVGLAAATGLLISLALEFGLNIATLSGAPNRGESSLGAVWAFATGTRAGWSILARFGPAVLLLGLLPGMRRPAAAWISVPAAVVLPAGITTASHAAGGGVAAFALDWLHMVAVSVWIGGLVGLLVVLWVTPAAGRPGLARALVPRFSMIAAIGLAIVVVTGALGVRLYVPGVQAATGTPYGRTLLVKLALVAGLVGLGAVNRTVVRPRLAAGGGDDAPATRRLLLVSGGEVALSAVVLWVVAVLTLTPPAQPASPAATTRVLLAGIAGDVNVRLTITPAAPGWNHLDVIADGPQGAPVASGARVQVRLLKLDEALDPRTVVLRGVTAGHFVADGWDLGVAGWWQVEVVVRRAGRLDESTVFPLWIEAAPGSASTVRMSDAHALRLLAEARTAWALVRSWRETQQLTDGTGGVYLTWVEAERPDRQRFRTSTGVEVVALGATRYQRDGTEPWKRYVFSAPVLVEGPVYFLRGARDATLGRSGSCGDEPCRVVFWAAPDRGARFAAWIGTRTRRPHTLLMIEPTHFMTLRYSNINEPVEIREPE